MTVNVLTNAMIANPSKVSNFQILNYILYSNYFILNTALFDRRISTSYWSSPTLRADCLWDVAAHPLRPSPWSHAGEATQESRYEWQDRRRAWHHQETSVKLLWSDSASLWVLCQFWKVEDHQRWSWCNWNLQWHEKCHHAINYVCDWTKGLWKDTSRTKYCW